mgnify:CR=1 FL=1
MNSNYLELSFTGTEQKFSVTEKIIYSDISKYINTEVYLIYVSALHTDEPKPTIVVSDYSKAIILYEGFKKDNSLAVVELHKATLLGFERYNSLVFNDDLKQIKKHEQFYNTFSGR